MFSAKSKLPSSRSFGLLFSGIFAFLFIRSGGINFQSKLFLIISIVFILIALLCPSTLDPLNRLWMKLGYFMGNIVSPVIMGIIFFLLITPIAIIIRINGRDELLLKRPLKSSYWRAHQGRDNTSFKDQF
jgi:hypothetical protein